jgi:hypothetical protein
MSLLTFVKGGFVGKQHPYNPLKGIIVSDEKSKSLAVAQ